MKIAFLTSCLEPGCDGVGDYTTLLAEECAQAGHPACRIALNDSRINAPRAEAGALRLPESLPWGERVARARDFIEGFGPDYISLQFVCYGFHPRGIDWHLAVRLREITGGLPVEIMFHELWIGAENGASLKDRVTGSLQRHGVMRVLDALRPRVVHTSNPAYAAVLQARGIGARILPLFGSVPVLPGAPVAQRMPDRLAFGMFGTLHPVWPPEPLFSRLGLLGKKITILHAGRLGSGEALWEKITRDYGGAFEFQRLGALPPEKIAEYFSTLDFGIATSPWEIIGKSASVAAMLEHGLPVIVNRDDTHYDGWRETGYSPLLIRMDEDLPARLAAAKRGVPRRILPEIASRFLEDLHAGI